MAVGDTVCDCITGTSYVDPITGQCICLAVDAPVGIRCATSGAPYKDSGGVWRCPDGTAIVRTIKPTKQPPVTTPATASIFDLSAITNWIKEHPFIVAGGAAFILYLLFFRRGGSMRRY